MIVSPARGLIYPPVLAFRQVTPRALAVGSRLRQPAVVARNQRDAVQQHPDYAGRRVEEVHDVRARANEAWLVNKFKESEQRAHLEREQATRRLHEASKLVGSWRRRALAAEKKCVILTVSCCSCSVSLVSVPCA